MKLLLTISFICIFSYAFSTTYKVGPTFSYPNINDVPWENMSAGDTVLIHWRSSGDGGDYREKWVINVQGTAENPFVVSGVPGPGGELPVINGDGATTRTQLSYWNEERSVIKVGGSSIPSDGLPSYILIENLEIRSGHTNYSFSDDNGNSQSYAMNAASIHVEKVSGLIIRNCTIHDSGNGIFIASNSNNITIEKNYIYGNGNVGRFYEHNTYTEATHITYQYNRMGPLRPGADGNNLKDRSAGFVARYNWIEGGNRLMDLVDSGNPSIINHPDYQKSYVYGNILIEEDGGNNQVIHYGGDSGTTANYRKGILCFYHNTLYSIRAGNTTLVRLSSSGESADIRNNILYITASGNRLAILENNGSATIKNNLLKPNWVISHSGSFAGSVDDDKSSIETETPGFNNDQNYDFNLVEASPAIDRGTVLHSGIPSNHKVTMKYLEHQESEARTDESPADIGAFTNDIALAASIGRPLKAKYQNGQVYLTWTTQSEVETSIFKLYKSQDTKKWVWWQNTIPQGDATAPARYELIDPHPYPGQAWYQLSEVDENGQETTLEMVSIYTFQNEIVVYPNPFDHQINLRGEDIMRVEVYNQNGDMIQQQKGPTPIRNINWPGGSYYLKIIRKNNQVSLIPLIKK